MKNDRTLQAIGRQLKAMGCERFDIGVRDATTGQMMNREWSAAEVLQNTPWLKRMNAQGNDVYIRPAEQERHGLVLVDDLSEFDLDDMKAEGREPALVVETSPKNYSGADCPDAGQRVRRRPGQRRQPPLWPLGGLHQPQGQAHHPRRLSAVGAAA